MNKWSLVAFFILAARSLAQTNDVPPPAAPFVVFPEPDMAFTITVSGGATAAPTAAGKEKKLLKVDAVQVGKLRRDILTWDDKSQTQTWFVGRYGLVQSTYGNWINLIDPVRDPLAKSDMLRRDASDYFAWLGASNYAGMDSYKGRTCYHFRMGAGKDPVLGAGAKEAWIDVKTKEPVGLQLGGDTYAYEFTSPPPGPLVMPTDFKARADRYQLLGPAH